MADSIKLPGIGPVKTPYVIGGGALVLGIVGYAYYKHRQSESSAATGTGTDNSADTSTDPYPPDGTTGNPTDPDSTDPNTGETYGDEGQIATSEDYGVGGSDYDASTGEYYDPADGLYDLSSPYSPTTGSSGAAITTNAAWSQAVTTGLEQLGYNPLTVAEALGLYLDNKPLSASEAQIIQVATAEYGNPPVGTYAILPAPVGTSPATSKVKVPNLVGSKAATAQTTLNGLGLKSAGDSVPKGKTGTVISQSPKSGSTVAKGSTVTVKLKIT
jgi:PASTA domain